MATLQNFVLDDGDGMQNSGDGLFGHTKPLNIRTVRAEQEVLAKQESAFAALEEAIDDGYRVIKSLAQGPSPEMPELMKFKKTQQQAAVRVAMVEFQQAFSSTKENRLLVVGENKWLAQYRLDYIQSFYNHVDTLSTWELYWNMSSKGR